MCTGCSGVSGLGVYWPYCGDAKNNELRTYVAHKTNIYIYIYIIVYVVDGGVGDLP